MHSWSRLDRHRPSCTACQGQMSASKGNINHGRSRSRWQRTKKCGAPMRPFVRRVHSPYLHEVHDRFYHSNVLTDPKTRWRRSLDNSPCTCTNGLLCSATKSDGRAGPRVHALVHPNVSGGPDAAPGDGVLIYQLMETLTTQLIPSAAPGRPSRCTCRPRTAAGSAAPGAARG